MGRVRNPFAVTSLAALALVACKPNITPIAAPEARDYKPDFALPLKVGVMSFDAVSEEELRESDQHVIVDFARRASLFLEQSRIFAEISYPWDQSERVDLILRGAVEQEWTHHAGRNFAVVFPGELIFMPAWYGFDYRYAVTMRWRVLDGESRREISTYTSRGTYEVDWRDPRFLIPDVWIYTALIAPGVYFATRYMEAHQSARRAVYEEAHEALFEDLAGQLLADREIPRRARRR